MISVRGINVFPEKIEEVLAGTPEIGPGYSLSVTEKMGMNDRLKVSIETSAAIQKGPEEKKAALLEGIHLSLRRALGLRVEVELVGKDRLKDKDESN
jgi:phenylacetate-coenzyme A ligase PaaK-like adenylate-forming protein